MLVCGFAAVFALLLVSAADAAAGEGVVTLRGKVTNVGTGRAGGERIVMIEVAAGDTREYGLVVGAETKLERAAGKRKEPAQTSEIKVSQDVEAVCSKIMTASNPPLVPKVKSVVILEKK
jgi:hypothetical protein